MKHLLGFLLSFLLISCASSTKDTVVLEESVSIEGALVLDDEPTFEIHSNNQLVENIYLDKKDIVAEHTLSDVMFGFNKSRLTLKAKRELNMVVSRMKKDKMLTAYISGHTDNVGTAKNNNIVATRRAKSVARYLESQGISKKRIMTESLGSKYPIAPNNSSVNRQKNRRVEIKLKAHPITQKKEKKGKN